MSDNDDDDVDYFEVASRAIEREARIAELEADVDRLKDEISEAAIGQALAQQGVRAAVLAEREACAKIAQRGGSVTNIAIATAIRARPAP